MQADFHQHSERLRQVLDAAIPFVVVTLAAARGSIPQIVGAKAIVTANGLFGGTVGGGKIEARAISHAQLLLTSPIGPACELVTWNLQTDIGMTCGGEAQLLFEVVHRSRWNIVVFGAGHVAQSLVPLLLQLSCSVTCLDSRPNWLQKLAPHPRLVTGCSDSLKDLVADLDPNSFFLLMTQGHATDLPILAEILMTIDAPYVGVIGSRQKAKVLRRDLRRWEIPDDRIDRFHCPIGLPLGNNTPAEISISIAAQLLQERDKLGILPHKSKSF